MHETAQTMVERADKALYSAKHEGRNQVKCAEQLSKATAVNA
jgi:PleD family two-component response regulator